MSPGSEVGHLATRVRGRYVVRRASTEAIGTLVGCHGYGETAEAQMAELERIPGIGAWDVVAINALHNFYRRSGEVVSSWMTSRDRELAIEDNRTWVSAVVSQVVTARPLVVVGFSQGVAMSYRAAAIAGLAVDGVVALAGDLPPELAGGGLTGFPPVLIARGDAEEWYTAERASADAEHLRRDGVTVDEFEFAGGHEWTDEVRARIAEFLRQVAEGQGLTNGAVNSV